MTEEVRFDINRSQIVSDSLDPETASNHLFLIVGVREATR